jgi:Transposase and inactivated derivatives
MQHHQIIGVDVSKLTLDLCIKPAGTTLQVSNDLAGFKLLKKNIINTNQALIVMEHTGPYSCRLEKFLHTHGIGFCKIPALQIKRSLGVVRGKSDKLDAGRIAEYGWLRKDQLVADVEIARGIMDLRSLLSLRSKMVRDRSGYMSRLKESLATGECVATSLTARMQREIIKTFTDRITKLESQIRVVIRESAELKQNFELLTGIKGVGPIIAAYMLAYTNNFTRFSNPRKFNCYAGLAPFTHQSGTSIRGRSRVSHLANKELKTLLNLGASCAIQHNAELKTYYQRRVAGGMRKMSCLNIIRCKIVTRMFAIIKRQSPYVELQSAA